MSVDVDKIFQEIEKIEGLKKSAIEALLEQRKEIDIKLKKLGFNETPKAKESKIERVCKLCGQSGHNARTCPNKTS